MTLSQDQLKALAARSNRALGPTLQIEPGEIGDLLGWVRRFFSDQEAQELVQGALLKATRQLTAKPEPEISLATRARAILHRNWSRNIAIAAAERERLLRNPDWISQVPDGAPSRDPHAVVAHRELVAQCAAWVLSLHDLVMKEPMRRAVIELAVAKIHGLDVTTVEIAAKHGVKAEHLRQVFHRLRNLALARGKLDPPSGIGA